MNSASRIALLDRLGDYIKSNGSEWQAAKQQAEIYNGWFTPAFTDFATRHIADTFLTREKLEAWIAPYELAEPANPLSIGIVMAGNIPLVGFHDWLCVFIAGHKAVIKPSSKDEVLIKHLVGKLTEWDSPVSDTTIFAPMLKGCDAYIATGSNNSAGYFDYYFGKYPHIIRRNRTSAAILTGHETAAELDALANDVFLYFGLGCRNVTKLYVPEGYDFVPLITAFKQFDYLGEHHKYKNNYDYNLAIHLLNNKFYMSTPALLMIEEEQLFSPISQLNYGFYSDKDLLLASLQEREDIQCIAGTARIPFGQSQLPQLEDYADGADTLKFLSKLAK